MARANRCHFERECRSENSKARIHEDRDQSASCEPMEMPDRTRSIFQQRLIFHDDFLRVYSPRNSVFQVEPLSVDFSQDCSTLSALARTIVIRFSTACPSGPRLGPTNSAEPGETFPSSTCTRP